MINPSTEHEALSILKQYLTVYKRTSYGKLLLLGGIILLGLLGNVVGLFTTSEPHLAVIQISGEIGVDTDVGDGQKIANHILDAINNDDSNLIVIETNSPGGSPTDSQTINEVIVQYKQWKGPIDPDVSTKMLSVINDPSTLFNDNFESDIDVKTLPRKLIVAVVTAQCASACIQAIINADIIISQRASLIGNIGVRLDSLNWAELAKKVGVTNTVITSGKFKGMLNPWKAINEEQILVAKKHLVLPVFEQFKADVLEARADKFKISNSLLFSGLAWTGDEALRIGLIDATSNPVIVQSSLEKIAGNDYKLYSKNSFSLGAFIKTSFNEFKFKKTCSSALWDAETARI
jgi:protease-4